MQQTGWTGEDQAQRAAMQPLTAMALASQAAQDAPGATLAAMLAQTAAAEAREQREVMLRAAERDPDEAAAAMLRRGYRPGELTALHAQLADCEADLETERVKIERGARRQERLMARHAAGHVTALDIANAPDSDDGDAHRAEVLARRADRLRERIRDAAAAAAPPRADDLSGDGVEAASRRANAAFRQHTRDLLAEARPAAAAPRPFASRGAAVRSDTVTCSDCASMGATPDESFLIHNDPDPVPVPDDDLPESMRSGGACPHGYIPSSCAACRTSPASRSAPAAQGYVTRYTEGPIRIR